MKARFTVLTAANTVSLVMDTARARALAEAMELVDVAGVDATAIATIRAAADDADRLGRVRAEKLEARQPLRVVGDDQ